MNSGRSTLSSAKSYIEHGWSVVPVPHRSKRPILSEWQNLEIKLDDVGRYFTNESQNLGILLGERSGGLVDIDLDSPEAIKLADYFLPKAEGIFGRKSKPASHRLYICKDAKYQKFVNPLMRASASDNLRKNACIVELRTSSNGKGIQTVFPPSVHETGEAIEWQVNGRPEEVQFDQLDKSVRQLAAASLVVEYWQEGVRNDLALSVAGTLLAHGYGPSETKHFITAVGIVACDEELDNRIKAVDYTFDALAKGKNTYGIPKLAELTDRKIVDSFCDWLGIRKGVRADTEKDGRNERLNFVCMKDIKAEEVKWLWKPFIPIGEFTILEGIEGIGKSWIGCALACSVASGGILPFHDGESLEPSTVLLLSAEDSLAHTIRPRLDSMGANLNRIFALSEVFSLNDTFDLTRFEAEIAQYNPKLVFIDPMFSYTAGKDLNAESSSRPIARNLIALAQKYNCAIVGVRHVGKNKGQGDPRNAGLGSIAWRASARSVLLVGQDVDNGERAICQTKSNLAEQTTISVSFDIVDGKFLFGAKPSSLTKERMLAQANDPNSRAEQAEAVGFLSETLRTGDQPSKQVESEAKELGITAYALRKAKAVLGVHSFKKGGTFGGDTKWYLRLPGSAEVVDIREFQRLQRNTVVRDSSNNGLTEDVEIPNSEQDQQLVSASSGRNLAQERRKAICECGEMGYVDSGCRNCGTLIPS